MVRRAELGVRARGDVGNGDEAQARALAARCGEADSVLIGMSTRSSPVKTDEIVFRGVSLTPDGFPQVAYSRSLSLEGERLGTLFVLLNGQRLVELTQDYIGLGETGEVLIVERQPLPFSASTT